MSPARKWTLGLSIGGAIALATCIAGMWIVPRPIENPVGLVPHILMAAVALLQLVPLSGVWWLLTDLPLENPLLRALWKSWVVISVIALLPGALTVLVWIAIALSRP